MDGWMEGAISHREAMLLTLLRIFLRMFLKHAL